MFSNQQGMAGLYGGGIGGLGQAMSYDPYQTSFPAMSSVTVSQFPGYLEEKRRKQMEIGAFRTMVNDIREFVKEHRGILYTIAILFLLDHLAFNGKFRERLMATIEKLVTKCEKEVAKAVK